MTAASPRVGVLALQGDVREHVQALEALGADVVRVRRVSELNAVQALVIPGGESSVIDKLSRTFGLFDPIRERLAAGMPAYGTCAGLIMLADTILDGIPGQQTFGGLDIVVRRNAFGAQVDSFEAELAIPELGPEPVHAAFIRAPIVEAVGDRAQALARVADGRVVAVRQGNLIGTSFHPEITGELRFHRLLLELISQSFSAESGPSA